jgi:hypothetical protein
MCAVQIRSIAVLLMLLARSHEMGEAFSRYARSYKSRDSPSVSRDPKRMSAKFQALECISMIDDNIDLNINSLAKSALS